MSRWKQMQPFRQIGEAIETAGTRADPPEEFLAPGSVISHEEDPDPVVDLFQRGVLGKVGTDPTRG